MYGYNISLSVLINIDIFVYVTIIRLLSTYYDKPEIIISLKEVCMILVNCHLYKYRILEFGWTVCLPPLLHTDLNR